MARCIGILARIGSIPGSREAKSQKTCKRNPKNEWFFAKERDHFFSCNHEKWRKKKNRKRKETFCIVSTFVVDEKSKLDNCFHEKIVCDQHATYESIWFQF